MWNQANTLPENGDNERFTVYLAFDDQSVKLADWCSYTTIYMTDDGFDVRKSEDGEWETFCHHEDGTKTRVVVVGWMEAMKPVPQWDKAEVHPLDDHGIPICF